MIRRTETEWKKLLTPEQYMVLREGGTEAPFTGEHLEDEGKGIYICAACGNPLFDSDAKFDSGTGWPSFFEAIDKGVISGKIYHSKDYTEVTASCRECLGHLGHLFEDGPEPTGLRYCINSASLDFKK